MVRARKTLSKFYELKIGSIMQKKGLPLIEKNAPISRVLPILAQKTHVWVTESKESKKIIGVITEHDVLSILAPPRPPYAFGLPEMKHLYRATPERIMSRRLVKCSPKDTVEECLEKMARHRIRRLPVLKKDDTIVGEIRIHHIIKYMEKYCLSLNLLVKK